MQRDVQHAAAHAERCTCAAHCNIFYIHLEKVISDRYPETLARRLNVVLTCTTVTVHVPGILVEHVLCAVAMVNIPVKDQHSTTTQLDGATLDLV